MDIRIATTPLSRHRDDAVVLLLAKGESAERAVGAAGRGFLGSLRTLIQRKAFTGDEGQVRLLVAGPGSRVPTLVLAGVGGARGDLEAVRKAAAAGLRAARDAGSTSATVVLPAGAKADAAAEAVAEGAVLGLYRFEAYKSERAKTVLEHVTILVPPSAGAAARRGAQVGTVVGEAGCLARDLGNEPSSTATPAFLARRAKEVADRRGLSCEVLEVEDMKRLGMGALLGVAKGSHEPAKLIVLTYEPPRKGAPTVAIVGKGITFDTGGISIKPSAKLEDMKFDMCGGAAVIAAMDAIGRLGAPVRVVGLVPATENMPGGGAYKPGDILKAMNGLTIEVKNTDAEGRLILADALAYATSKLKPRPKAVLDLATLTGACVVALGDQCAGMVANDERLASRVLAAAEASGDSVWRMPMHGGYRKQMESSYADLSNLGGGGAGALTAAAFLERFAGKVPWAHLDIAGVAWTEKEEGYRKVGATGFGVRLLTRLLTRWGRS